MQVVTADFVKNKKVLLRYDIDVALRKSSDEMEVAEDFKLRAGLETVKLCLDNASKIIVVGHLGRPAPPAARFAATIVDAGATIVDAGATIVDAGATIVDAGARRERGEPFKTAANEKNGNSTQLSAKPIQEWLEKELGTEVFFAKTLEEAQNSQSKVVLLENIRFFHGEVPGAEYHATCTSRICDLDFAKQLASLGEVYVNEAFSAHNVGASTTMVPTLMPHAAGLHFAKEVRILREVRENPKKPFIAIMGGAKVKDKLPVINVLARSADAVLVGGKLIHEIREQDVQLPKNVMVGKLNEDGFDISPDTTEAWKNLIERAAMIVWNGPLGKFEDVKYDQSGKIARLILDRLVLDSEAEIVVGGGDTVALLGSLGLLGEYEKKAFVSVGGGAMLKLLSDGTLPTIQALE